MARRVVETIAAYDDASRTLTYEGSGLPALVAGARNHWRVMAVDAQSACVSLDATVETRGIFGPLLRPLIRLQLNHEGRQFLRDLKHFAEHNQPSPRKQRQLKSSVGRNDPSVKKPLQRPLKPMETPVPIVRMPDEEVVSRPVLNGLHHVYQRVA